MQRTCFSDVEDSGNNPLLIFSYLFSCTLTICPRTIELEVVRNCASEAVPYSSSQLPQGTFTALPDTLKLLGAGLFWVQTYSDGRHWGEILTGTWSAATTTTFQYVGGWRSRHIHPGGVLRRWFWKGDREKIHTPTNNLQTLSPTLISITGSSPRCPLLSHSLVFSKNN